LAPGEAEAWQLLGDSALRSNRFGDAEEDFRRAIALHPSEPRSQIGLGTALLGQRRAAEALASFREATRLAPQDALNWIRLGKATLDIATSAYDLESARQALEKGIALRPDVGPAYLYLGQCSLRQQRWQEARDELTRAEGMEPLDPDAPFALAQVYRRSGDTARAETALRRHEALSRYRLEKQSLMSQLLIHPRDQETRLKLARRAAVQRDYTVAVSSYRAALAQAPNDAVIARELAEIERRITSPPASAGASTLDNTAH
jgi:cytochrome c-type biogenesis protein CcmH/NrfG